MNERDFAILPSKTLFRKCAVPSVCSIFFSSIYTIADGIFVGKFLGYEALASVNFAMPVIIITFALSDMIAVGSSVRISINLGEQKFQKANAIFSGSVLIIMTISIFLSLFGVFFADNLFALLSVDKVLSSLAYRYIKVAAYFLPLILIFFAVDNYLRLCGKVKFSMCLNIFTAIANIALDWLFLAKLGLGIEYASLATCLSISVGTIIAFIPFVCKKLTLRFTKPVIPIKEIWAVFYNGSSEFLSSITGSVLMLIVNTVLIRLSGATAVAAFSIIMYIDQVMRPIIYAMTDSIQPAVSYNYGAKNYKKIMELYHIVAFSACVISILAMILVLINPIFWASIFAQNGDFQLIELTKTALYIYMPAYLFLWYNIVVSMFLTGLDNPRDSLILMFAQTIFLPLLMIVALTSFYGVYGVFLMSPATQCIAFILSVVLWRRMKKKLKDNM